MGLIRNIKTSIDDRSSMSVNSIILLLNGIIGAVIGIVVCFVLVYDVVTNGYVKTDLLDLGIFLMSSGAYIAGSGMPKTIVDSRLKNRGWQFEEEERIRRRKKAAEKFGEEEIESDCDTEIDEDEENK